MKNTGRVWAAALIIQPMIFAFIIPQCLIIIVPIEIIASIPGILTFGLVLHALTNLRISIEFKWILIFSAAIMLAYMCSWVISSLAQSVGFNDVELSLPAPIAACLGVLINAKSIHKQLKNEEEITKDPESSIFNV